METDLASVARDPCCLCVSSLSLICSSTCLIWPLTSTSFFSSLSLSLEAMLSWNALSFSSISASCALSRAAISSSVARTFSCTVSRTAALSIASRNSLCISPSPSALTIRSRSSCEMSMPARAIACPRAVIRLPTFASSLPHCCTMTFFSSDTDCIFFCSSAYRTSLSLSFLASSAPPKDDWEALVRAAMPSSTIFCNSSLFTRATCSAFCMASREDRWLLIISETCRSSPLICVACLCDSSFSFSYLRVSSATFFLWSMTSFCDNAISVSRLLILLSLSARSWVNFLMSFLACAKQSISA
mmetsp:Transcript_164/g.448  ORF Transcript_164/g.448 Transcript_164/m.448 type:complete len:301 (-) Transcript_164:369-1271(-)